MKNSIKPILKNKLSQGQIVLVLVLLTMVGLTIGISLISRTVTDVRMSSQIEQSNRAFSAAEAGVESALKGAVADGPTGAVSLPGASAVYSVSSLGGSNDPYIFPVTDSGKTQTVWLIPHNDDGTINLTAQSYSATSPIDVCWGSGGSTIPAMVMTLLYNSGGNSYKISKKAYDPDNTRYSTNHFIPVIGGKAVHCSGAYTYIKTITPTVDFDVGAGDKLIFLKLQPVYAQTAIAVEPDTVLPIQGRQIISVGQTETGTVRKIQVTQGYYSLPEVFDFTFFGNPLVID